MDQEKFNRVVDGLNEYEGVKDIYLLNDQGEVILKSGEASLTNEEGKAILKSWKEKELAAKNIAGGKGNVAGSITKEGDYLIIHTDSETSLILLEWSILVNKLAWS